MKTVETKSIRVVIADDHSIFRTGLANSISEQAPIKVVGEATNGKELVALSTTQNPDVVITDIRMPVMNGIEAASLILKHNPCVGIIALSIYDSDEIIQELLTLGVKGYITKDSDSQEIIRAIQAVNRRENYYSNTVISKIIMNYPKKDPNKTGKEPEFTEKELQIMKLICEQHSSKEIAAKLGSTVRSVESAKERIQSKTGVKNVVGIALYAISKMFVSLNDVQNSI